ncbi:MAG: response regulator [Promethearchaeota archaeon]
MITISILIVNDDTDLLFLYQKMIEHIGFEVVGIAFNGEKAVELYKLFQRKPDIILMDHRMPKIKGVEVTKEILNISNHSKIIFKCADKSVEKEILSIGAVSSLEKPFSLERLRKSILNVSNLTQ